MHPKLEPFLEKIQTEADEFTSQFEIAQLRPGQALPDEAQIKTTVAYPVAALVTLTKEARNSRMPLTDFLDQKNVMLRMQATIEGEGAAVCASLMQDAMVHAGFFMMHQARIEKNKATLDFVLETKDLGKSADMWRDHAQALFDNRFILQGAIAADKRIKAVKTSGANNEIKPILIIENGQALLKFEYRTSDVALIERAERVKDAVQVKPMEQPARFTHEISLVVTDPKLQEKSALKLMDIIASSVDKQDPAADNGERYFLTKLGERTLAEQAKKQGRS